MTQRFDLFGRPPIELINPGLPAQVARHALGRGCAALERRLRARFDGERRLQVFPNILA